jgi:hypothetical protein
MASLHISFENGGKYSILASLLGFVGAVELYLGCTRTVAQYPIVRWQTAARRRPLRAPRSGTSDMVAGSDRNQFEIG